jgi:hypothetical protein
VMWERFRDSGYGVWVSRVALTVVAVGVIGLVLSWWLWPSTVEFAVPTTSVVADAPSPTGTVETLPSSTVAPVVGVSIGSVCDTPGVLGVTGTGTVVLCSETSLGDESLDAPVWRETAAGDVSAELSVAESVAVAAAKQISPVLALSGDHAVLIFIEETAAALVIASDAGVFPGDTFLNLVNGVGNSNNLTNDEAALVTIGVLAGVQFLVGADDPVTPYADQMVEWFRAQIGA